MLCPEATGRRGVRCLRAIGCQLHELESSDRPSYKLLVSADTLIDSAETAITVRGNTGCETALGTVHFAH